MPTYNKKTDRRFTASVIFYGGLWGLVEATLGFLLHKLPELLPVPPLAGMVLFPVGLFFMIRTRQTTGRPAAVPATALVAASIKALTVLLPFVSFRFVRNPVIAILAEGAVVWAILGVGSISGGLRLGRWLPVKAIAMSVGWRVLFIGINAIFGLSGIMSKPLGMQLSFLFLEGAVDAVLIVAVILILGTRKRRTDHASVAPRSPGMVSALATFLVAFGGQALFSVL